MYITSTMTSPATKTAKTSKWLRLKSYSKGQLISKQNSRAVTSPKKQTKRTEDSILSVFRLFSSPKKGTKCTQDSILSVFRWFLGEVTD